MVQPLNYSHRIVLVVNIAAGTASAIFVSDLGSACMMRVAADVGSEVACGGAACTVLVLVCPEDVIKMREGVPPSDLRETQAQVLDWVERLIEENIRIGRPVLAARSPS